MGGRRRGGALRVAGLDAAGQAQGAQYARKRGEDVSEAAAGRPGSARRR